MPDVGKCFDIIKGKISIFLSPYCHITTMKSAFTNMVMNVETNRRTGFFSEKTNTQ
jgi:hypothetical protein